MTYCLHSVVNGIVLFAFLEKWHFVYRFFFHFLCYMCLIELTVSDCVCVDTRIFSISCLLPRERFVFLLCSCVNFVCFYYLMVLLWAPTCMSSRCEEWILVWSWVKRKIFAFTVECVTGLALCTHSRYDVVGFTSVASFLSVFTLKECWISQKPCVHQLTQSSSFCPVCPWCAIV